MKHKYHAKPTVFNSKKYPSLLEARYAQKLELAKKSGDLLFYLEQVPLRLGAGIKYVIDFVEFWAPKDGNPGEIVWTECKGMDLQAGRNKRAQALELYPWIEINLVRK